MLTKYRHGHSHALHMRLHALLTKLDKLQVRVQPLLAWLAPLARRKLTAANSQVAPKLSCLIPPRGDAADVHAVCGLLTSCRPESLDDFRPEGGNPGCTSKSWPKQRLPVYLTMTRRPLTRKRLKLPAIRRGRAGAGSQEEGREGGVFFKTACEGRGIPALFLPL